MSHDSGKNWLLSEEEVFNWFKLESRTYNWQAMVALDRLKTNELLMQEYVERYGKSKYFDPITKVIPDTGGSTQTWSYLYDHVLGPPRLSFENSDTNAKARLTMSISGGLEMTVEQVGVGPKQAVAIYRYDPLQAPRLLAEIALEDTTGEVENKTEVELDLKRGTNFLLTYGSTALQQKRGGDLYQGIFDSLPDEDKRFRIGSLAEIDGAAVLRPDKFRLRALSARPARAGESEGSSEGAILMFVGTEGHEVGQLPDADSKWIYPIPVGRTSTMLVSNDVIFKELLVQGIFDSDLEAAEYEYIVENNRVIGIKFLSGKNNLEKLGFRVPGLDKDLNIFGHIMLDAEEDRSLFILQIKGEDVHMDWSVAGDAKKTHWVRIEENVVLPPGASWWIQCGLESRYRFAMNAEGNIELTLTEEEVAWVNLTAYGIDEVLEPYLEDCKEHVKEYIKTNMLEFQRTIAGGMKELELFTLYGLLFTGSHAVDQKSVRFPNDLAAFGDIAPKKTAFKLNAVEKDIIHGGTFQFGVQPAQTGLTWKLEKLPGFEGSVGTLSTSGLYTAPTAEQLPVSSAYTMVRITASKGDVTTSGLIRVIRRPVVVNPMVRSAGQVATKLRYSGGALGGGKLTWAVTAPPAAR